jgi:predicted nucleic acid-binding protein
MAKLFADTYALIEILKGSPNYERFSHEELITSEFNIFELTYAMCRDFSKADTTNILLFVRSKIEVIIPGDQDYLNASEFRISSNKIGKKLSLIDALGYACSNRLDVRFLTGDREFKDVENVLFIK